MDLRFEENLVKANAALNGLPACWESLRNILLVEGPATVCATDLLPAAVASLPDGGEFLVID